MFSTLGNTGVGNCSWMLGILQKAEGRKSNTYTCWGLTTYLTVGIPGCRCALTAAVLSKGIRNIPESIGFDNGLRLAMVRYC